MPWRATQAKRHTKKASTRKKAQKWTKVANSVLKRTGDEGQAVRAANAAVKHPNRKR